MGYIDTLAKRQRLQRALAEHEFYSGKIDGDLGPLSITAIIKARAKFGLDHPGEPVVDTDLERELGLLTIEDPIVTGLAKSRGIDLATLISLIGPISAILKGKPMTTDQIGGLVRAILTFLAGLAVAKGWVDNATALTIVGGLVTIATAAWSIFTNRPSKIASN